MPRRSAFSVAGQRSAFPLRRVLICATPAQLARWERLRAAAASRGERSTRSREIRRDGLLAGRLLPELESLCAELAGFRAAGAGAGAIRRRLEALRQIAAARA